MFSFLLKTEIISATLNLLSANSLNSNKAKILSYGKQLSHNLFTFRDNFADLIVERWCQIILKSIHHCKSCGPDKIGQMDGCTNTLTYTKL